jgi:hypothetical protein
VRIMPRVCVDTGSVCVGTSTSLLRASGVCWYAGAGRSTAGCPASSLVVNLIDQHGPRVVQGHLGYGWRGGCAVMGWC